MRWILRLLSLAIAMVALAFAALYLMPADRIAAVVSSQASRMLGREVAIGGDVRPSLWPVLGIRTGALRVGGAPGGAALMEAEGVAVAVDWTGLFGGAVRVRGVELIAPVIRLERGPDGRGNWEGALRDTATRAPKSGDAKAESAGTGIGPTAPDNLGGLPDITLDRLAVTRGRVLWHDAASGQQVEATGIAAELRVPDLAGKATVQARASVNGKPVALEGRVEGLGGFLSGGAAPVAFDLDVDGATAGFDGRAGLQPVAAQGRLTADLSRRAGLFAILGQPVPELPPGLGRDRLTLAGAVTYTEAGLALRGGRIVADDNAVDLEADVAPGAERPRVTARVGAGTFDLTRLSETPGTRAGGGSRDAAKGGSPGRSRATAGDGWPTDPIDASSLQAMDGDIVLVADAVRLPGLTLGALRTRTTIDAGRAVTTIDQLSAYDGTVAGTVVANARGGFSARADLTVSGIAMAPLLSEVAGYDRLVTRADGTVSLLGSGASVDALMRSLSGDGRIAFGKGEFLGLDLVGMVRTLDANYRGEGARTVFDGIEATFRVRDGVLRNDDFSLTAPLLTATGEGRVDIGQQRINYTLTPRVDLGGDRGAVAVPVTVRGDWMDPSVDLDLAGVAQERLGFDDEAVREDVQDQVGDALGIKRKKGEDLDDAAKRQLRRDAERELRKLLGVD